MEKQVPNSYAQSWAWADQSNNREQWPTITNKQGTTIPIQPRRIIVKFNWKAKTHNLTEDQIHRLKAVANEWHRYDKAPEPLKSIDSHLQVLATDRRKTLYVVLTNISSQILKKSIYNGIYLVLQENYKSQYTWIQAKTQDEPPAVFDTSTVESILEVISKAQTQTAEYLALSRPAPPWTYKMEVIFSKLAIGRGNAALPERMEVLANRDENDQAARKRKQDALNKIFINKAKKTKRQAVEEHLLSDEEENNQLAAVVSEIDQIEGTTHSSSTRATSPSPGTSSSNARTTNNHRPSSPSTTEMTSTSSTPQAQREETPQRDETESLNSFMRAARGLQRRLVLFPELDFSGTTFYIASASVSKHTINLGLEAKTNSETS